MRVGLFSDYFLAKGDGTAIATHISRDGLENAGHEVYVFCPVVPGSLENLNRIFAFRSVPGYFYQGLRFTWPLSPSHRRIVKNLKLDVIHVQTPLPVGLFGLWCGRKLKAPTVFTSHLDMDFMDQYYISAIAMFSLGLCTALISGHYRAFLRKVFSSKIRSDAGRRQDFAWRMLSFFAGQFDQVVAPSKKSAELLKVYLPADRIAYVPNGIKLPALPTRQEARAKLGLKEEFVIVSTARHVREKRIDMLLLAFASFSLKAPAARLWLLNDGPQREQLTAKAERLGIIDKVNFLGTVTHEEVFNFLVAADVFANVCLREVASLGILEAAACGKPLLLADKRLTEPLEDGHGGYFVHGQRDLRTRLGELYNDPALTQKLGEQSKNFVRGKYSQEAHAEALLAVYNRIV